MPQFPTTDTNLKLKDLVTYIGENLNLKTQYAGTLEVWEISNKDVGCYACLTEDGWVSSWLDFDSLKLVNAIEVVAKNMWLKGSAKSAYEDSFYIQRTDSAYRYDLAYPQNFCCRVNY